MITIRDATIADAPALCDAEKQTVLTPGLLVSAADELTPQHFAERISLLSEGRGKYLVASASATPGTLIGHACLYPMPLQNIAHVLRLDMCVHPGCTGKGVGRLLLDALIAWARQHPHSVKIELLVRATNLPAIALYSSAGFVEEGRLRQRVKLPDGRMLDDFSMAYFLK